MFRPKTLMTLVVTTAALFALRAEPPLELPAVRSAPTPQVLPLPDFVLPLLAILPDGSDYAVASGFVAERERGLIATAAHTNTGNDYRVLLPSGTWLPLTRVRIDRGADVALLRIPEGAEPLLPIGPPFRTRSLTVLEPMAALGWRLSQYRGGGDVRYRSAIWIISVVRPAASMCDVSPGSCMERLEAVVRGAEEGRIQKKDKHLWYDRFVVLVDWHNDAHLIPFGMSGGPIMDEHGEVVGLLVSSNGFFSFATPIEEVKKLMR